MKINDQIPHGKIGHFCHGGCAGYAEGGVVDAIREFMLKHNGTGGVDDKEAQTALNVDVEPSSGTARNYAEGGMVEEDKDPSIIPEEIKEFVQNRHKEQRESRPDENWRIRPAEKPESVAPYKKDEEEQKAAVEAEPIAMAKGGVVPGYDDGGQVDFDPNADLKTIAPAGAGILTPPPAPMAPDPAKIQTVPAAPPVPPSGPIAAASGARPAVPALTDQDFSDGANKMLGLNPQEQASFLKMLGNKSQLGQIGAGVAGIGDAIASGGTLGKVNPGNLGKAEDIIQNKEKQGIEGMQTLRGNQEKATELSMKLQAQDPNSPLSKYAQKAYGGLGKKLGLDLSHASASMISDITGKGVSELNDEAELALKEASLGLQKQQVSATIANQAAERANAAKETGLKADTEAAKHWLLHPKDAAAAQGRLAAGTSGSTPAYAPDVMSYAQKHGITPEMAQEQKNRRMKGQ